MTVVILCGGRGSRFTEETEVRPKPMVEIGGKPILWHIMNIYAAHGFSDFTLALGYKGEVIKQYFLNYHAMNANLTLDLGTGEVQTSAHAKCNWRVHLVDTGIQTLTGGRLRRLRDKIRTTFLLTYGDGVSDINVRKVLEFHLQHRRIATLSAVRPPARFGEIQFDGDRVAQFREKPQTGEGWINGGFFIFEPKIFEYLDGDDTILEKDPLERLAKDGELMAYRHTGFWQCMDTMRDRLVLEALWEKNMAPWKVWND